MSIKFYSYLAKRHKIITFLVIFLIANIYAFLASYIINIYNTSILDVFNFKSLHEAFILSVLIGPLLETFLFQYLIIEILYKFKINNNLIIWLSAILFALTHNYNLIYLLAAILPGLLYASYYLYLKKEKKKNIFFTIYLLHALSNLVVFILDDVLKL